MHTISSPLTNTQVFGVLKLDEKQHQLTESVDTFLQVASPDGQGSNDLLVTIFSLKNDSDGDVKESLSAIPQKDSTTSQISTEAQKATNHQRWHQQSKARATTIL